MTTTSDPRADPPGAPVSPAAAAASALLDALIRHGVRDVVLSPGSRSQALALAAARREADGRLRLHVRIDERVGGFLALGLAVETRSPVAVIVTSGTAVANLHPAVLEASHAGVPLLLLTADRPAELLGTGANQTTVQSGIFGTAVRRAIDVPAPDAPDGSAAELTALVGELLPGLDGPAHLNLAYREPLSGGEPATAAATTATAGPGTDPGPALAAPRATALTPRPGTVVVAGTGAGPPAEELARALGAPLLAEVSSGARFGPNAVPAYRRLLGEAEFGGAVDRVVVLGHPTLTREVPALIQRDGVETVVVRGPGRDAYDPGHRVAESAVALVVEGEPDPAWARPWVGRWVHASRALLDVAEPTAVSSDDYRERADFAREQLGMLRAAVTRRELVEAVWASTWPHDRLVLGASRLIREADAVVPGKRLTVHANRGLSGIDGTVATAIGVALASQDPSGGDAARGTTRVLLGDLALLHDVGALLFGLGERRPRIQVIVGDDGGGTIFDSLEVAGTADPALFDRVLLTPQRTDLASLAAAYGWDHRLVANRGDLSTSLTAVAGPTLVEVPLPR